MYTYHSSLEDGSVPAPLHSPAALKDLSLTLSLTSVLQFLSHPSSFISRLCLCLCTCACVCYTPHVSVHMGMCVQVPTV